MQYYAQGSETDVLGYDELKSGLFAALSQLGIKKKVLAIPPDFTRFHSQAGILTRMTYNYYKEKLTDILPAIGTHFPMTEKEIGIMYRSSEILFEFISGK